MLTAEENERITRVGPGTPGGEWLRRYWHLVRDPARNVCIELEAMTSERDQRGGARPRGLELPRTLQREAVFDARHEVFDVPYGPARPSRATS